MALRRTMIVVVIVIVVDVDVVVCTEYCLWGLLS